MNFKINLGDRVEVTRTLKGGFIVSRYQATVIHMPNGIRIKVRDDEGNEYLPYFTRVKKIS